METKGTKPQENLPKEPLELRGPKNTNSKSSDNNQDVKTLLSWQSAGRPFKKRTKQYYLLVLLIALLVEVILFLFSQYALMAMVMAFVFLVFALAAVPPKNFHYRISSEGITIEDHFFLWTELYDFYFRKQHNEDVLIVRTHSFFPGELTITLGQLHKDHVKSILLPYLPYREYIKPTFMEKSGDWLTRNFPLERKR